MALPNGLKAAWERLAFPLGFTSLVVAFVIGQIAAQPDYEAMLQRIVPDHKLTRVTEAEGGQIVFHDETEGNYVVISEAEGYGGPLVIGIRASAEGKIVEILSLQNKETPAYFEKVKKEGFFRQFARKKISDDFMLGEDIDAVSGATITSRGFTDATRSAMHIAATEHFKMKPTWKQPKIQSGCFQVGFILKCSVAAMCMALRVASVKPREVIVAPETALISSPSMKSSEISFLAN